MTLPLRTLPPTTPPAAAVDDAGLAADMTAPTSERPRWGVAAALAALLLGGLALHGLGIVSLEPSRLVALVRDAGLWGVVLFWVAFAVGTVANVPGLVFVGAAVTLYGPLPGFAVALVGAILAVNLTFALGRFTRLGSSSALERPLLARVVRVLHQRPILTLTVLRAIVLVSPPVNYALALTKLRHRDYAIGSALGLVVPLFVVTQGMQCLLS